MDHPKNKTFGQLEAEIVRLNGELTAANEAKAKAQTPEVKAEETDKRTHLEIFASLQNPVERGRYWEQNEKAILADLREQQFAQLQRK